MLLDQHAFKAAFESVEKRLYAPPYCFAPTSTKLLREHRYAALPPTLEELLEANLHDDAMACFVALLCVQHARPRRKARASSQSGKGAKSQFTYFDGDLEIRGNFTYEHTVFVQGDLIVDGLVEDKFEGSQLFVAGNVRAKGVYLGSTTHIGGSLDASDLIFLRYTRGQKLLVVGEGAKTRLFVRMPNDTPFAGKLAMKHHVEAFPRFNDPAFEKLHTALVPSLAQKLAVVDPDLTLIVKALRDAMPLWR